MIVAQPIKSLCSKQLKLGCQTSLILNLGSIQKANYVTLDHLLNLLVLTFLICNMGIQVSVLRGCSEDS